MNVAGDVYSLVADALRYTTDEDKLKIRAPCQLAYYELCELAPWLRLQRAMLIAPVSPATILPVTDLPADTVDVIAVTQGGVLLPRIPVEDLYVPNDGRPRWYYAAPVAAQNAGVRLKMGFTNGSSGANLSGTVTVYYWVYPPRLDTDQTPIMLPSARPLVLRTIVDVLGLIDKKEEAADRYRAELQSATATMMALNPLPAPVAPLRSRRGTPLTRGGRR
jgi:hypothetical protein